jgi:hypothetical protein
MDMIRVELGEEVKRRGKWRYVIKPLWNDGSSSTECVSSQPLLDACRLLKSTGAAPRQLVGLFRAGRDKPDLTCTVEVGAGLYVREDDGPRFVKWIPWPPGTWSNQKDDKCD